MNIIKWFFLESGGSVEFPAGIKISAPPFFILLAIVLYVASIIWVARDATKRGKSGRLAGIFAALAVWPCSLLFWLWLRPANLQSKL